MIYVVIGLFFLTIGLITYLLYLIVREITLLKAEQEEYKELSLISLVDRYEDAEKYLEKIVNDSIAEYNSVTPSLEKEYITEEAELEIRSKVKDIALEKISLLAWHRLEQIYKEPANIIGTKIYLAVTLYVIDNNGDIEE